MQNSAKSFNPIIFVRSLLLSLGFVLFVTMGSQFMSQASDPDAARGMRGPHSELSVTGIFSE
jgi:hypothetical protein